MSKVVRNIAGAVLALSVAAGTATVASAEDAALTITLKNHKFDPAVPTVPAGVRVKLTATNLDESPAEIESDDFKLEKIIPAGKTITVIIGPLKPGTYHIYDEYHEDDSRTEFIAK